MGRRIFTDRQLEYVKKQYKSLSVRRIADELDLSESQVRYIIKEKLKVSLRDVGNKSRGWVEKEIEILRNPNLTDFEKTKQLPSRTDAAVRRQRRRLGFESKEVVFLREHKNGGYIHVRKDNSYQRRNRVVAEQKIGRKLKTSEVVHHINGIKTDDRPSNLHVCTRGEHTTLHYQTMEVINELMEKNYVRFDEKERRYVLCRNL